MGADGNLNFSRSVSQRAAYRDCNRKWLLQYMAGWKQRRRKAAWVFGNVMESVCNAIVMGPSGGWIVPPRRERGKKAEQPPAPPSPVVCLTASSLEGAEQLFLQQWEPYRMDGSLIYPKPGGSSIASWHQYRDRGRVLARLAFVWIHEHFDLTPGTFVLQDEIRYPIGDARELCYLDFRGRVRTAPDRPFMLGIVDFKTAQRREPEHYLELDEQMTTYQVGSEYKYPGELVMVLGHLRMIATTEPKLQPLWAERRSWEHVNDFLAGAAATDAQILAGNFGANTRACHAWGGCAMQPVCFESQKGRLEKELQRDEGQIGEAIAAEELEL